MRREPVWAYGITTVPARRHDLLPGTIASLRLAGFDHPWLFVDGEQNKGLYDGFGSPGVICHYPRLGAFGNWIVGIWLLYIRQPNADRYAMFQDDIVVARNLRAYLESMPVPDKAYFNLYTAGTVNTQLGTGVSSGFYRSDQHGRGAQALVFTRDAVTDLLTSYKHIVNRPQDRRRGKEGIDGGVVSALKAKGWHELIHKPSLVQHTAEASAIGHQIGQYMRSVTFAGEDFDCLTLLNGQANGQPVREPVFANAKSVSAIKTIASKVGGAFEPSTITTQTALPVRTSPANLAVQIKAAQAALKSARTPQEKLGLIQAVRHWRAQLSRSRG